MTADLQATLPLYGSIGGATSTELATFRIRDAALLDANLPVFVEPAVYDSETGPAFTVEGLENFSELVTSLIASYVYDLGDQLISLRDELEVELDEDGNVTSDNLLAKPIPGTDVSIDGLLDLKGMLGAGEYMQHYVHPILFGELAENAPDILTAKALEDDAEHTAADATKSVDADLDHAAAPRVWRPRAR